MMPILRAASFLFVVLRSHAARPGRNDSIADALARAEAPPLVHAEHFEKTVAHTEQIKAAVDRVHEKTQVAKEAAVAVKDSFGKYQGTISDLKAQLDSVDDVAHKFEDDLWSTLAKDESTRLQPFEEYKKRFGDVEGVEEAEESTVGASPKSLEPEDETVGAPPKSLEPEDETVGAPPKSLEAEDETVGAPPKSLANENATAELSFLESGHHARHSSSNESTPATGGNRFEKSVQQSEQIKVAVGKVQEKVQLARKAAAKVKNGFEDYKGKVVEVRKQLNEVDKQQHEYHEKLLNHYDGQEGDRMSAFDNPPSLESEGKEGSTTPKETGLLQSFERGQLSKEHVSVNVGGSFHAARR